MNDILNIYILHFVTGNRNFTQIYLYKKINKLKSNQTRLKNLFVPSIFQNVFKKQTNKQLHDVQFI